MCFQRKCKASSTQNKQELKMAAVQAWQSITRKGTPHLVIGHRLQAVIACKGYAAKYKNINDTLKWAGINL
uniref:Uncharacterized protein n=1 Tax=Anguilla anguilla TaxID=7936 RepID=A0A0E9QYZ9_ANGAN